MVYLCRVNDLITILKTKKMKTTTKSNELINYYNKLTEAQKAQKEIEGTPFIGRIDNPKGVCNTLWIPYNSDRRSATFNLNHTILGFNEEGWLIGENGNCMSGYVIVEVPNSWGQVGAMETWDNGDFILDKLAERVCKRLNKPDNYYRYRALKVDNLSIIIEEMNNLTVSNISPVIELIKQTKQLDISLDYFDNESGTYSGCHEVELSDDYMLCFDLCVNDEGVYTPATHWQPAEYTSTGTRVVIDCIDVVYKEQLISMSLLDIEALENCIKNNLLNINE